MPVAVDAAGTVSLITGAASASFNYTGLTVGSNTNGAIVVTLVAAAGSSVDDWTTVTGYTQIADITNGGTATKRIALWAKVGNSTGAQTISVTCNAGWQGADQFDMCAVSFTGVDQTGGTTSFNNVTNGTGASGTTPSLSVNTAGTDCIVGAVSWNTNIDAQSDTLIYIDTAPGISNAAQYALNQASPHTLTWSRSSVDDDWLVVALNVKALAVASKGGTLPLMGVGRHDLNRRIFAMPRRCLIAPRRRLVIAKRRLLKLAA